MRDSQHPLDPENGSDPPAWARLLRRGGASRAFVRSGTPATGTWLAIAGTCGLVAGGLALGQTGPARRGSPQGAVTGPLFVSESLLDDGRRLLVVVDSTTRHAAVYHLDAATGTLALKSTRDLSWDLVLEDFNAQEPTPAALRRALETAPQAGTPRGP